MFLCRFGSEQLVYAPSHVSVRLEVVDIGIAIADGNVPAAHRSRELLAAGEAKSGAAFIDEHYDSLAPKVVNMVSKRISEAGGGAAGNPAAAFPQKNLTEFGQE